MEVEKKAMKPAIVLYPAIGYVGHIFPMIQLAHALAKQGYAVTVVLLVDPPPPMISAAAEVERIMATTTTQSISFHLLPPIPAAAIDSCSGVHERLTRLQRLCNQELETLLRQIKKRAGSKLHSLVMDIFNFEAPDVAAKVGVPVYTFFTSGAAALAAFARLPAICADRRRTGGAMEEYAPLLFPGAPPMPTSCLLKEALLHPEDARQTALMHLIERFLATDGILVNTVESLETTAVRALRLCDGAGGVPAIPRVYCVGPLVGSSAMTHGGHDKIMSWLDAQPGSSVVFLCFGSQGVFSEEQLTEIAVGLQESGQRFIWAQRGVDDGNDSTKPNPKLGLLETNGRGLVVQGWVRQVDVLRHPATGGFVTHCGWNSTLEALMAGVPMLCWPLYGEQRMNKVFMTSSEKDGGMGIGVSMEGSHDGFVTAKEVAAKVRLVMVSDQGKELRARVALHREAAEAALEVGGSSQVALRRFLSDAQHNRH